MVPVGIDYGLTSPSHATDKSMELRKLGPLLNESLSELPDSCWLDLARRNGFLQHIPCMFYGGSRWLIQSHNCSLLKVPVGDAGPMCTGIIIHQNEIRIYSTCIWANMNIQNFIDVPLCRQCAVIDDVQVCFPLSANSHPHHNWTPAIAIMLCNTNFCKTFISHPPDPSPPVSEVHTKPGLISEKNGVVIKGPRNMISCPF